MFSFLDFYLMINSFNSMNAFNAQPFSHSTHSRIRRELGSVAEPNQYKNLLFVINFTKQGINDLIKEKTN